MLCCVWCVVWGVWCGCVGCTGEMCARWGEVGSEMVRGGLVR